MLAYGKNVPNDVQCLCKTENTRIKTNVPQAPKIHAYFRANLRDDAHIGYYSFILTYNNVEPSISWERISNESFKLRTRRESCFCP